MRFVPFLFAMSLIAALSGAAQAQDADQSLKLYAVHVLRVPREKWTGIGVYLGDGRILTAAHVAGNQFFHKIEIEIGGQVLPGTVLKQGRFSDTDPAAEDLALVSIDETTLPVSLRLRRMPICQLPTLPGEPVIVVTPEGIAPSHVISPALLPPGLLAKFTTAIADVATTGYSGSGVFDAKRKCLLGIISGKITVHRTRNVNGQSVTEPYDIAKFFVPAPLIAEFIAAH